MTNITLADLKRLSTIEMERLAAEIRQTIVKVVSENGGHLSSSLGSVELAIALHAVFDSPRDKIIWDVGHQAYAHKILTGREDRFASLRQYRGISGFLRRDESPHDVFGAGHASTSISAALGIAKARDLRGENFSVVAIIGDASLPGGLALEAINNTIGMKTNFMVVLNDNEMSISPAVGAMAGYLTKVRTSQTYLALKKRVERIIERVPRVGVPLREKAERLKDRFKHLLVDFKANVIFEELGFKYLGPIDGHNIPLLISTFHYAREVKGPVLVHIYTRKGKGYPPAEKHPTRFHGVGPFEVKTGEVKTVSGPPSYTEIFGKVLATLAEKDSRIIAITAAMLDGTGLEEFARRFPNRLFDVGIAEEHAVTFAAGAAAVGMRPFCAIYSTFLQRAFDQVIHDVCLQNLPVVFCLDRAGIVGEDGPTHHGAFDLAYLRSIPNIVIAAPKDESELQHLLYTALQHNAPFAIRYPRGAGEGIALDQELRLLPIAKGEIVYATDDSRLTTHDLLIIAIGSMVYPSVEAAKTLEGISVKVINARYAKPLDRELILEEAKKTERIVTVEEGALAGGFGSAVLELLQEENLTNIPVKRIGIPDEFVEHGKQSILREAYGLTSAGIASTIRDFLATKIPA